MTKLNTITRDQDLAEQEMTWFSHPDPNHAVHFYPYDKALMTSLTDYFRTGLQQGDTCIAIATPKHIVRLNASLRANGINVPRAIKNGQYMMFDAEETLATFMVNGMPDYQRFVKSIGRIIYLASGSGQPVRAFGEMVAVLWKEGNLSGLVQLEEYWHDLVAEHSFSLYCAYPKTLFSHSRSHREAISRICNCHALSVGAPA